MEKLLDDWRNKFSYIYRSLKDNKLRRFYVKLLHKTIVTKEKLSTFLNDISLESQLADDLKRRLHLYYNADYTYYNADYNADYTYTTIISNNIFKLVKGSKET